MSENMDGDSGNVMITMETLDDLDMSTIEDMPWAKKLYEVIVAHNTKAFLNWCRIVKKLVGTQPDNVRDWSRQYLESIDETCCELVNAIDLVHTKAIDKIPELLGQLQKLCQELHQKMPTHIGKNELGLLEEQNRLMRQVKEYETIINEKKDELAKLHKQQQKLCSYLGKEPKIKLKYPPLPTPCQLEEFQKHIEQLEHEKFEREERYYTLRDEIMKYVEELKYKPRNDFERAVFSSDNLSISLDNLKKLELLCKALKEIKKSTVEEISQLRLRIEDLWKMLDVDLMDRDEFRSDYVGNSLDVLESLKTEVKRCEEIRKANIKVFVEKFRDELQEIWTKCHCTDVEKRAFKYFTSDCYTEDLLDLHEIEIQKWKNYYEENGELLRLLEKHSELWEKVIELEENATGPNRYKNRGGKLLQEEKERNKLSKQIPKIEEEIFKLSEQYQSVNGVPFLTFGKTPEMYIEYLHEERENNKKLKLSARKIQRDNTKLGTPAKSAINLFASTSAAVTPSILHGTKRKILATPNTDIKKIKVNTPRSLIKPKGTPLVLPTVKVTHATLTLPRQKRRSRSSMERKKRLENLRRRSRRNMGGDNRGAGEANETRNTTYTDFQNELSSRDDCRSTFLPDQILKVSAATIRKTPLKTPSRTPTNGRTPSSRTPKSASKIGQNITKLSACKSNLKLLF